MASGPHRHHHHQTRVPPGHQRGGGGGGAQALAQLKLRVLQCISRMEDRDTANSAVRELQALLRGRTGAAAASAPSPQLSELGVEGLTVVLNAIISGYRGSTKAITRRECINALTYICSEDACPLTDILHLLLGKASTFVCRCFKDGESSVRSAAVHASGMLAMNAARFAGGKHAGSVVVRTIMETLVSDGCQNKEVQTASCKALAAIASHSEAFSDISGGGRGAQHPADVNGVSEAGGAGSVAGASSIIDKFMRLFVSPTFHAHASLLHLFGNCDENTSNGNHGCSGIVIREGDRPEVRHVLPLLTSFAESILESDARRRHQIENLDWHARVASASFLQCIMTHFGPEIFAAKRDMKPMTSFERLERALHAARSDRLKPIRSEVAACLATLSLIVDTMRQSGDSCDISARQWRMRFSDGQLAMHRHPDHRDEDDRLERDATAQAQKHRIDTRIEKISAGFNTGRQTRSTSAHRKPRGVTTDKRVCEAFLRRAMEEDIVIRPDDDDDDSDGGGSGGGDDSESDERAAILLGREGYEFDRKPSDVGASDGRSAIPVEKKSIELHHATALSHTAGAGDSLTDRLAGAFVEDEEDVGGRAASVPGEDDEGIDDGSLSDAYTDSVINDLNNQLRLQSRDRTTHYYHHHFQPAHATVALDSSKYAMQQQGLEEQLRFLQEQQGDLIDMVTEMREKIEKNFAAMSSRITAISSTVQSMQMAPSKGGRGVPPSPHSKAVRRDAAPAKETRYHRHYRARDAMHTTPPGADDMSTISDASESSHFTLTTSATDNVDVHASEYDDHEDRTVAIEKEIQKLQRQRRKWEQGNECSHGYQVKVRGNDHHPMRVAASESTEKPALDPADGGRLEEEYDDEMDMEQAHAEEHRKIEASDGRRGDEAPTVPSLFDADDGERLARRVTELLDCLKSGDGEARAVSELWNLLDKKVNSLCNSLKAEVLTSLSSSFVDKGNSSLHAQAMALRDALEEMWKFATPSALASASGEDEAVPAEVDGSAGCADGSMSSDGIRPGGEGEADADADACGSPSSGAKNCGGIAASVSEDASDLVSELSTQHVEEIAKRMDVIADQVEQLAQAPLELLAPDFEELQRELAQLPPVGGESAFVSGAQSQESQE